MLPEGLECIGACAFVNCVLLSHINIPSSVKVIDGGAFLNCASLESVELPDGLEVLGKIAFRGCESLQSIKIPPRIKVIDELTFADCIALQNVHLPEGLETIEEAAFQYCISLRHIKIPSTVRELCPYTFSCTDGYLEEVQFCDNIEEFVRGESLQNWWGNGILWCSLAIYNFLVRCNVPARLKKRMRQWQANIYDMLRNIPSDDYEVDDICSVEGCFDTIESKLDDYEKLPDPISVLELAIWKSKMAEQHGQDVDNISDMARSQCRDECGASVIIPFVLSFL